MAYRVTDLIYEVRLFMRDHAELNRLISDVESLDESINLAAEQVCDIWNSLPPFGISTLTIAASGDVNVVAVPTEAKYIFVLGASIQVMKSVLFLRARNRLAYNDGNISVDDQGNVFQGYMTLLGMYQQEFESRLRNYKAAKNVSLFMNDVRGSLGSDYAYLYFLPTGINY
jgi:hypothetical protein